MDRSNPPEITTEMLMQNPVLLVSLCVICFLFLAFVAGACTSWALIGYRLWHRESLLEVAPWSPRVWGLADLGIAAFLLFAMQGMLASIGIAVLNLDVESLRAGEDPPLSLSAVISASYLVGVVLTVLWIVARFHVGPAHVGLTHRETWRKLSIGLAAGFATLPFIYLLSAVVNLGFEAEYEHPILDTMREDGNLNSFLLAFFAAALVAPFAEEMLFRVFLQGWLQSLPFSRLASNFLGASQERRANPLDVVFYDRASDTRTLWAEDASKDPSALEETHSANSLAAETATPDLQSSVLNPYATASTRTAIAAPVAFPAILESPTTSDGRVEDESGAEWYREGEGESMVRSSTPPIWPSLVAGTLFGLAHWGYGLSFIPLIFLGIVLGLLYRATRSVWPCVVVHFMLNASSLLLLGLNVLVERAQP